MSSDTINLAKEQYNKNVAEATTGTTTSTTTSTTSSANTIPGNTGGFLASLLFQLMILFFIILLGSIMLYSCRVAQSNILPTLSNCFPYTSIVAKLVEQIVNIDIVKHVNGDTDMSTKLKFPYTENMKQFEGGLFGFLREMIESPKATVFGLYFGKMLQTILATNISMLNGFYNLINSFVNETLIIFIMPSIMFIPFILSLIVNSFYMGFLWMYNLSYLISSSKVVNGISTWTNGNIWTILNLVIMYFAVIFGLILLFSLGLIVIPLIAFIIAIYSFILPLFMHSQVENTKEAYGLKDTFLNIWRYKKSIIMFIITLLVISNAFTCYGGYTGFAVIVFCLILNFFTKIFHRYIPTEGPDLATPGLADFSQAVKECNNRFNFKSNSIPDNTRRGGDRTDAENVASESVPVIKNDVSTNAVTNAIQRRPGKRMGKRTDK